MQIEINTNGYKTPQFREVKTISFWQGVRHIEQPINKELIEQFLAAKKPTYQIIVTANGHIYATDETPGYCDGEHTANQKALLTLLATLN